MAEDVYHGRMSHHIARQPGAKAFLILDEEIFAYPKHGSHTFVDAFETVAEMEQALGVPAGSPGGDARSLQRRRRVRRGRAVPQGG